MADIPFRHRADLRGLDRGDSNGVPIHAEELHLECLPIGVLMDDNAHITRRESFFWQVYGENDLIKFLQRSTSWPGMQSQTSARFGPHLRSTPSISAESCHLAP